MIENGLHYHLGYKYQGQYEDGLEAGLWTITKTDVLVSTMEFKEGFQDGEMKIYKEAGDIICLVEYDNGELVETNTNIINLKEIMRVLQPLCKKYSDVWKVRDADYENDSICRGEGYLMENVDKE